MFKNSRENGFNFIDKDELERTYKHQEKLFNAKLQEQQHQINELVDYVSARFGEDFGDSDINNRIDNLENSVQEIEDGFKANFQYNIKTIENEVKKYSNEMTEKLKDIDKLNAEKYNEYGNIVEQNSNDVKELKDIMFKKIDKINELNAHLNETDSVIKGLNNIIMSYDSKVMASAKNIEKISANNDALKKTMQDEFDKTNKKIGKINYLGITTKFEKKLKEESDKLKDKIINVNKDLEEYIYIAKQAMIEEQENAKKSSEEITKIYKKIDDTNNTLNNEIDKTNLKIAEILEGRNKDTNDTIENFKSVESHNFA